MSKGLFLLFFLMFLSGLTNLNAEQVPATFGAPYIVPDSYVSTSYGDSIEAAAEVWWEKYKPYWGVSPFGGLVCSYTITTSVSDGFFLVGRIDLTGQCRGADAILRTGYCPPNYVLVGNKCEIKYELSNPKDSPPPNTCPSDGAGNPIESGTGTKRQYEQDIDPRGLGQVSFSRTYRHTQLDNEPVWHNNYGVYVFAIMATDTQVFKQKSRAFSEKADACTTGWSEIKANINESWASGAIAVYQNGTCNILNTSGAVVKNLPIIPSAASGSTGLIPGAVEIRRADGSTLNYQNIGGNSYRAINGDRGYLVRVNGASVMWRYVSQSGVVEEFASSGKLLSIIASNGMKQTLTYDNATGRLSQVQDATGRTLTLAYTNNLLRSVTVDGNQTTTYAYNGNGLVADVKRPDNTHRLYHYEDIRFPKYLTGITDERGVRYATWKYDSLGRAISSEHAGGVEKTSLTFNANGSTTVTNPLNKSTIYHFGDIAGTRRVVRVEGVPTANCVGANQNYTYTAEGWVESKTDWNGNKTTYIYNSRGQEISRTEAADTLDARIVVTEWDPISGLKTKVTEPDKETIYSYDANGLLLNQTTRSLP